MKSATLKSLPGRRATVVVAAMLTGAMVVTGCGSQQAAPDVSGSAEPVAGASPTSAPAPESSPAASAPGGEKSSGAAGSSAAPSDSKPSKKQKPPAAQPTPLPSLQGPSNQALDPGESPPKAGPGPSVEQIAAADNKQVVKVGPYKQAVGDVVTYQTQYFIGRGGNQIGSVAIATGSGVGAAPGEEELEVFRQQGVVERRYDGTILRYKAGEHYLAIGYFGDRLITLGAVDLTDLKALYDYFRASS